MMTEHRFAALAEAYGGEIGRWPPGERAVALAYVADHPEAPEILRREQRLDASLDAYRLAAPGAVLQQAIVGLAPAGQAAGRLWRWLTGAGIGLGLAAACASGAAAGMILAPASVTRIISGPPAAQAPDELTALIDPSVDPEGA